MECLCAASEQPLVIVSEENRHCRIIRGCGIEHHRQPTHDEQDKAELMDEQAVAALPALTHHSKLPPPRRRSPEPSLSEVQDNEPQAALPFSREVIAFSLFGRIHPKCSKSQELPAHHNSLLVHD